jgi:hypothetical protein
VHGLDARTGHLDHHLSTALKQLLRLPFEVTLEEGQGGFGIIVHQDAYKLDELRFL